MQIAWRRAVRPGQITRSREEGAVMSEACRGLWRGVAEAKGAALGARS